MLALTLSCSSITHCLKRLILVTALPNLHTSLDCISPLSEKIACAQISSNSLRFTSSFIANFFCVGNIANWLITKCKVMNYFTTNKIFHNFFVLKNVNDAFLFTLLHVKHFCIRFSSTWNKKSSTWNTFCSTWNNFTDFKSLLKFGKYDQNKKCAKVC